MTTNRSIDTIRNLRAYSLADHAGCMSPDSFDSIGARFLLDIRDEVVAAIVERHDDRPDEAWTAVAEDFSQGDESGEVADIAIPIYTGELWATFTDLGAWEQDIEGYGVVDDMTKGAQVSLYEIARQLISVLVTMVEDDDEDDDDEMDEETARELHMNGVHTGCPHDCLTAWDYAGNDVVQA